MEETEESERDGEEAPRCGRGSIMDHGWDIEEVKIWVKKFVAREAKRNAGARRKQRTKEILKTLFLTVNPTVYCMGCGKTRQRDNETADDWIRFDLCSDCREGKVRIGDRQNKFCRYCCSVVVRAEVLAMGKSPQAWVSGNKCYRCVGVYDNIVAIVNQLLQSTMSGGAR